MSFSFFFFTSFPARKKITDSANFRVSDMGGDDAGGSGGGLSFFSASEVASHNTAGDCWVTVFGRVLDLSPLVHEQRGALTQPLVKAAGTDVSHWFEEGSMQPRKVVDPDTGLLTAELHLGRYVHVPPREPLANHSTRVDRCWWEDVDRYCVGLLSQRTRSIRVVNTLTAQEDQIEVCSEEKLSDIRARYEKHNSHASGYTWKFLGRPLSMSKTLDENGVPDESDECARLRLDETASYVPALFIYYNDDLTVA